jgi:hypothetical protein
MWVGIVVLGAFFSWMMFYSFYLVIFSKDSNRQANRPVKSKARKKIR